MRGEFGQKINADALKNGFYIPACGVAGGFRNITNNLRPIKAPEDLKSQGLILQMGPPSVAPVSLTKIRPAKKR